VPGKKGSDEIQKFIGEPQDEALKPSGQRRIRKIVDLPAKSVVVIVQQGRHNHLQDDMSDFFRGGGIQIPILAHQRGYNICRGKQSLLALAQLKRGFLDDCSVGGPKATTPYSPPRECEQPLQGGENLNPGSRTPCASEEVSG